MDSTNSYIDIYKGPNPAETPLVMDAGNAQNQSSLFVAGYYNAGEVYVITRHGTTANLLFVDGHVEGKNLSGLKDLGFRWGRDKSGTLYTF